MDSNVRRLHVRRAQAVNYRIAVEGRKTAAPCSLIELHAIDDRGEDVTGLGEAQPRDKLTGDRSAASWDFLTACLHRLYDREFTLADREGAVAMIASLMIEFRTLSGDFAAEANRPVPFRGTLAGIEAALIDLFAGALDIATVDLLGRQRDSIPTHAAPISWQTDTSELPAALHERRGAPATLLWGTRDPAANVARLQEMAALNQSEEVGAPGKPLWIDLNGRMDTRQARSLIESIVDAMAEGTLPEEVLVEHPVGTNDYHLLPQLQKLADRLVAAHGLRSRVLIVSDARWWLPDTLGRRASLKAKAEQLVGRRAPGAVVLRPAQVGGVLDCMRLAERITSDHPEVRVCIGGMLGSTRVTDATLSALALSTPAAHSLTDVSLAHDPATIEDCTPAVDYESVLQGASEFFSLPPPEPPTYEGKSPNVYPEVTYLQPLGSNGTKGHLLEREALARGLSTVRYSKGAFIATDGEQEPLSFKWSRSPLSSAASLALCTHKEATRLRLQRAGVPVPRGTTFAAGAYEAARDFVKRIGYPVVVKPAMGVRGIGVVADIGDDEALEAAFDAMASSKLGGGDFIVEQHVSGRDYRIVVVGDEVIGAILREPGSVTGDGERTVAELVVAKNIARRQNPHLWGRPVKYDRAVQYRMERAGISLGYVPQKDEVVVLSGSCSLSQGGESIDVLDELHPDIKDAAVRAVKAVPGLAFCGVDFLLEDHTKPLNGQDAGICELNAHAAIGNCEYPLYGTGRPVAKTLMDACIDHFGLKAGDPAPELSLKLVIRGRVTRVGYRQWMQRRARRYGLTGWVRNVDSRTVEAVVVGDTEPVTALAAAAVLGPRAAIPTDVNTAHIDKPSDLSDFSIKRSWKEAAVGVR